MNNKLNEKLNEPYNINNPYPTVDYTYLNDLKTKYPQPQQLQSTFKPILNNERQPSSIDQILAQNPLYQINSQPQTFPRAVAPQAQVVRQENQQNQPIVIHLLPAEKNDLYETLNKKIKKLKIYLLIMFILFIALGLFTYFKLSHHHHHK